MAQLPQIVVQADPAGSPGSRDRPAEAPNLPLLRFGLRQLFLFVAAVSALLAGLITLEGVPALALLLAVLVVALHLFGAALGSQLRDHANRAQTNETTSSPLPRCTAQLSPPTTLPTPWYGRNDTTFAWLPRLVVIAVFFGGLLGASVLTITAGHRASTAGLVVGAMSVAALSGWFAFVAGGFYGIVRGGWRAATKQERENIPPFDSQ